MKRQRGALPHAFQTIASSPHHTGVVATNDSRILPPVNEAGDRMAKLTLEEIVALANPFSLPQLKR